MQSFSRVEQLRKSTFSKGLLACFCSIVLNLAWPSVFNSEQYLLSLTMLVFMILFVRIRCPNALPAPAASKFVWPYIAWMLFAALINAAYCLEASR